jgi:hypothetical protein
MANDLTVPKARPELMPIGSRALSSHGWRHDLFADHLKAHLGHGAWCDVGCAARTFFGRNTATNRSGIRRRLSRGFHALLAQGLFVVIDYASGANHHGEAIAFKLYNPHSEMERQAAEAQLVRMVRRREITDEKLQRARKLLGFP